MQILQALAAMLEQPGAERITTAALAARLSVSEAALYRHFASKAQMFEGLIDFIEQTVFTLVQQITGRELPDAPQPPDVGARQAARIVALLLQFGERNPGMVRVMVGDALVFENERLQQRMNQFFERIESTLRQCLRGASAASATPRWTPRWRPVCSQRLRWGVCSAMLAPVSSASLPSTWRQASRSCSRRLFGCDRQGCGIGTYPG